MVLGDTRRIGAGDHQRAGIDAEANPYESRYAAGWKLFLNANHLIPLLRRGLVCRMHKGHELRYWRGLEVDIGSVGLLSCAENHSRGIDMVVLLQIPS